MFDIIALHGLLFFYIITPLQHCGKCFLKCPFPTDELAFLFRRSLTSNWWVYIEFLSWLLFSKGGCNNGSFLHLRHKNLITVSDVQHEDAISSTMPDVESPSSSITICSFVIFKFSWIVYWVWYIFDIWRVVSISKINISLNRGPSVGPLWEVGIDQGKIMVWGEIIQVLIFSKTELQNGISNVGWWRDICIPAKS